jgi:diguanylate cyclase (GGDEF)-like protein
MGKVSTRLRYGIQAVFWLVVCAGANAEVTAESVPELNIGQLEHLWLRAPAEFAVVDQHQPLDAIKNAAFHPLTDSDINQGISGKIYWLRIRLYNDSPVKKTWLLHNDTSYLDNLVIYYRDQNSTEFQRRHLSDRVAFHDRDIDYRNIAFSHVTAPGDYTDLYISAYFDKADSVSLNFHLWDRENFEEAAREENLVYGGYYGALVILAILSLIFAALLRQASALYYAAFLLSTAFMWSLLNGYAFQYIWPGSVYWHNEGFHISFLLFAFFALQFSKAFLRTTALQPRTHWFFNILQLIIIIALIMRAFGIYGGVLHIAFAMLALLALVIPWVSWRAWREGLTYARWYTFAWLVYSLNLVICVTSAYTDVLQWGMQVLDYMQAGSLLEAILLMVAMSEWLLSLDTDRRKAIALANQDPLTGLGNRRLLQMQYEFLRERFYKDGQPVFLIMLDLDHFKQINDTYGHEAGDLVLIEIARLIVHSSRDGDVCIRYGGEEFAMLLRADSLQAVWQVAERIRLQFAQNPTVYKNYEIQHTLSSGITQVLTEHEVLGVQEMMARADAALYQGKSAGRNCNTIYDGNKVVNSQVVPLTSA